MVELSKHNDAEHSEHDTSFKMPSNLTKSPSIVSIPFKDTSENENDSQSVCSGSVQSVSSSGKRKRVRRRKKKNDDERQTDENAENHMNVANTQVTTTPAAVSTGAIKKQLQKFNTHVR